MCKYSIFNIQEKIALHPLDEILLTSTGIIIKIINDEYIYSDKININYIYRRNTFIKIDDNYIYEYDLLKIINKSDDTFITGIVAFKKGVFYLKSISKDGVKLKQKIALYKFLNDLSYEIKILCSILETENSYGYVRDRFFFKKTNSNYECAIDSNESLYLLKEGDIPIKINDEDIKLSTDVYDKNGNLLFESDSVIVSIENIIYKGLVHGNAIDGKYMFVAYGDDTEFKSINLNNNFNEIPYDYILIKD